MGFEDLPYGLIVPIVDEVVYDAFCIPVSIFQYGFSFVFRYHGYANDISPKIT
jgi:hypothetical protein